MDYAGYRWSLTREGPRWRWRAEGRDDRAVLMQGCADSRAEAAALLVRAIARGAAETEIAVAA